MATFKRLGSYEFATLFGVNGFGTPLPFTKEVIALIENSNSHYGFRYIDADRDEVLLDVLQRIDNDDWSEAGRGWKERWDVGWNENLQLFRQSKDVKDLVPKYIRPDHYLRLNKGYIYPIDPNFELHWYEVFRRWLFATYLADVETVYEFGCGSGHNLVALNDLYPNKKCVGLDWSDASVQILNEMDRENVCGHHFDFFSPDETFRLEPNSAVLTIGALEQTGTAFRPFIDYLLKNKPKLVINIEPICEWYDEKDLVDYAAIKFHRRRKYWEGFPKLLDELVDRKQVKIIKQKRSYFGSLFLEGYSQTIWRPI